ncbi:hypothetical protein EW146_g912 [Bondarzewia mesenterica]|uniref:SHSP domain-containing protein n=1 Tax=Bondarzewia mesenterica TaxID=1095465 RepID=A0A4V3XG88_9AGAM|nr:hypothetical protein EW146_g912 [Bondarzewia mesenterica]
MTVHFSPVTSPATQKMTDNPNRRQVDAEDYYRRFDRSLAKRYVQLVLAHRRRTAALRTGVSTEPLQPRMEICDAPDSPVITAVFELPGLRKDEIGVHITPMGRLTISGERRRPPLLNNESEGLPRYPVRELKYGRFERTVEVPPGLEVKDISANLADGMLSVSWPRHSPSATQVSQSGSASALASSSTQPHS